MSIGLRKTSWPSTENLRHQYDTLTKYTESDAQLTDENTENPQFITCLTCECDILISICPAEIVITWKSLTSSKSPF